MQTGHLPDDPARILAVWRLNPSLYENLETVLCFLPLYFGICIFVSKPWGNPVEPNCHSSLLVGLRDFSFSTENFQSDIDYLINAQYDQYTTCMPPM